MNIELNYVWPSSTSQVSYVAPLKNELAATILNYGSYAGLV